MIGGNGILSIREGVCSFTDEDGTTILDIDRDLFYRVNGLRSLVWRTLSSGAPPVLAAISAKFPDVPPDRLEADVAKVLEEFRQKRLIVSYDTGSGAKSGRVAWWMRFLRLMASSLLKMRLQAPAAIAGFAAADLLLRVKGLSALHGVVRGWPVAETDANVDAGAEVLRAVGIATTWYPKQALCLHRSAVTTCLLRQRGVAARMVIGFRRIPFGAHAWVEVDGRVVNEDVGVKQRYRALDRC